MGVVMFNELELVGSHGMQAHAYGPMLDMITSGLLQPEKLISRTVSLGEATTILEKMGDHPPTGVAVIDKF
jgi:alcohol dehydrogenase